MREIDLLRESIDRFQQAVLTVHKAFGAPGDYGYGMPKGDALQKLYMAQNQSVKSLKLAEEAAAE